MEKGVEMALVGDQGESQYLRTKALSNVANNVIMTNTFIPEWCATRLSGMELMPTQSTPSPANIFSSETDSIYVVLAASWHIRDFLRNPQHQIHSLTKRMLTSHQPARLFCIRLTDSDTCDTFVVWSTGDGEDTLPQCVLYTHLELEIVIFDDFSRSMCPFDCFWSSGNHHWIQIYTLGRSSNPFFVLFILVINS